MTMNRTATPHSKLEKAKQYIYDFFCTPYGPPIHFEMQEELEKINQTIKSINQNNTKINQNNTSINQNNTSINQNITTNQGLKEEVAQRTLEDEMLRKKIQVTEHEKENMKREMEKLQQELNKHNNKINQQQHQQQRLTGAVHSEQLHRGSRRGSIQGGCKPTLHSKPESESKQ